LSLLNIVKIRINAIKLGIEKLSYKNKLIRIHFVSNQSSPFYQSATFNNVLQWLQRNQKIARMEEKNSKLWLTIPKVPKMDDIIPILTDMQGA
jgi:transcription-repair coupling factor (superfamily II helicase)